MRLSHLLEESTDRIAGAADSDSARLDAELLVAAAIAKPRSFLYAFSETEVEGAPLHTARDAVARRVTGHPVAYILGEKEFWGLTLSVDERVLIPRPETELLVELALALPLVSDAVVADVGTGSGAIALALASEKPWFFVAADYSMSALTLAAENRARYADSVPPFGGAGSAAVLLRADWLSAFADNSFDLVLSNPPYIDGDDAHLQRGDVRFEPRTALVSDEQGLRDIRRISEQAWRCLKPGGHLLLEHGYQQGEAVAELLLRCGYREVICHWDLAGLPRVSSAVVGK